MNKQTKAWEIYTETLDQAYKAYDDAVAKAEEVLKKAETQALQAFEEFEEIK